MNSHDMLYIFNYAKGKYVAEADETVAFKKKPRKMIFLLAAVITVTALMGAGLYTRWSRTAQSQFQPSEEIKKQAASSGLSVMLEETKPENGDVLQATDQGITVTAVQSIIDNHQANIFFRVEGFDLPDGRFPSTIPEVTVDGQAYGYSDSRSGWFFDGLTRDENNKLVYASTGKPVESDENGNLICQYVAEDGSMEYQYSIHFQDAFGDVYGKEICFRFNSFDYQSLEGAGMPEPAVSGNWDLHWKLSRSADEITITLNAPIGDSGVTILDATIGQKTIVTTYQLSEPFEGFDQLMSLPQEICGVRLKDGTEHLLTPSEERYDEETLYYCVESQPFDAILDPSQVESLMFHKGRDLDEAGKPTIQTFYYIPIR